MKKAKLINITHLRHRRSSKLSTKCHLSNNQTLWTTCRRRNMDRLESRKGSASIAIFHWQLKLLSPPSSHISIHLISRALAWLRKIWKILRSQRCSLYLQFDHKACLWRHCTSTETRLTQSQSLMTKSTFWQGLVKTRLCTFGRFTTSRKMSRHVHFIVSPQALASSIKSVSSIEQSTWQ